MKPPDVTVTGVSIDTVVERSRCLNSTQQSTSGARASSDVTAQEQTSTANGTVEVKTGVEATTTDAEEVLELTVGKEDFPRMRVLGQFNK